MRPIRSLLTFLIAAPLAAQSTLVSDATVRSSAGGNVVAVLKQGTAVTAGARRGAEVYISFSGWLDGSKLGGAKDSFPVQLTGPIAMRLRSAPSMKGVIMGEVRPGAGLFTSSKQASWVNVKRGGWIDARALGADAAGSAAPAKPEVKPAAKPDVKPTPTPPTKTSTAAKLPAPFVKAPPVAAKPAPVVNKPAPAVSKPVQQPAKQAVVPVDTAPTIEPMPEGTMRVARTTIVRSSPNGGVVGQIGAGTLVRPLARSRGWVRVRAEVWVPERDVVPADSSFGASLSAADLRADPEGTRGKTVRWEVQVLALQYADPLRRDLAKDEPYFLAKGPGSEDQLLYLAIPPSLLAEARSIQALTRMLVTARVRTGRSQPVGIPILDILSLAKQ